MTQDSAPIVLFYGNCQAQAFCGAFRHLPFVTGRFSLHFIRSFHLNPANPGQQLDAIAMKSVVLVMQQTEAGQDLPDWFAQRLNPGVPRLRFTPLDTNLLWPLRLDDPRNTPEPEYGFGRYPYGDRLVVELLRRGLTGQAAFDAYLAESPGRIPDLARLEAKEAARLQTRDSQADVPVADIIADQMRAQPLFWTFNHPSGWLVQQVAARMLDRLRHLLRLVYAPDALPGLWRGFDPLHILQVPIHPVVAQRLELAWWRPDCTYRGNGGAMFSFDEHLRRYIDFT